MNIRIEPIPAFKDNYIWCLRRDAHAVVVDPGEAQPVLDYLQSEQLTLCAILCTHHHADHVGGVAQLLSKHRSVPVYGPSTERIATLTAPVNEGDRVDIPELGIQFDVLDIPGHTAGHIAYYGGKVLFCGDTLFACGCGRVFEGTSKQMWQSLSKMASLPDDTAVYCGHEYTLANIRFALAVEPDAPELLSWFDQASKQRRQSLPTLPSTIGRERSANPFLRADQPAVTQAASKHLGKELRDPVDVFAALREWKNTF